jgi:hypothetical protein
VRAVAATARLLRDRFTDDLFGTDLIVTEPAPLSRRR